MHKPALAIPTPTRPADTTAMKAGPYGHFSPDGTEYRIVNPRTPRPWVNVIANPRFGLTVSQTGSGFTWIDNSQLAVITRWQQDMVRDESGKFLFLRDDEVGRVWSLSPAPTWPAYDAFECRHGLGYTTFIAEHEGIRGEWTLFCDPHRPAEMWRVIIQNLTTRHRRMHLCAFLEWCCGVTPDPRREFHKLFIETRFDAERSAIHATSHMWDVPSARFGHWNTSFPYEAALATTEPVEAAEGDKAEFLGMYGSLRNPKALREREWAGRFGRHEDPIAALRLPMVLEPHETRIIGFVLAAAPNARELNTLVDDLRTVPAIEASLESAKLSWRERLAAERIEVPEPSLNYLVNDWVRYQAISGRLWGRCGYYQQSGAFGFRDQLQDSQVWLTIDPARCREQINLHAEHQFADGSVYHWWHPLTEQGHVTRMTDDLLWLAFVTANYIRETGDFTILADRVPFLNDAGPQPLAEHVRRAFERVFQRISPRGLPFIGAGDWNDGLSAVGLQERGESFWLGHFLAGLLADWAEIYRLTGDHPRAREFTERRAALARAINEHGWDGQWYLRATLDDGTKLGSAQNCVGRIFLNAQTWAVLSDVAPPDRAAACMAAVREHLVSDAGALLLAPAFDKPVEEIGYITRYAPGLRENGGVYSHAATWAIAAACKMKDAELAGRLLTAMNPAVKDPQRYWAEPYVLPGNVDGPDSPYHGRAGWTWYTGAAQWLHRVVTHWILGVRPEWDGLRIDPCLPLGWDRCEMTRPWRGCTYRISIERPAGLKSSGAVHVSLNGSPLTDCVVPPPEKPGRLFDVAVRLA